MHDAPTEHGRLVELSHTRHDDQTQTSAGVAINLDATSKVRSMALHRCISLIVVLELDAPGENSRTRLR